MRPKHEIAEVVKIHYQCYSQKHTPCVKVKQTLQAIKDCRTAKLGGHKAQCGCCNHEQISYNSCRNRHCPKCQATNRERWIAGREAELLPVPYYHIVFTLPDSLNPLALKQPVQVYNALFKAAWLTIQQFASDPKYLNAKTGMTSILHTWGQQLSLHPHLHCIVPAGGVKDDVWKYVEQKGKVSSRKGKYLYPKRALSEVFRAIYMRELRKTVTVPQDIAKKLFNRNWVVYAKQPFKTPETVVEYLGRYTHKVAISNHRLVEVNEQHVSFKYKNYKTNKSNLVMSLQGSEFLRRFALHILPPGFVRIRSYGILASRNKLTDLNIAKAYFGQEHYVVPKFSWQYLAEHKLGIIPGQCPRCKEGIMEIVEAYDPETRGPPKDKIKLSKYLRFA